MLTAIVLICSLAVTPDLADCTSKNARATMLVPEDFLIPTQCYFKAQAFAAGTQLGRDISPDERIKVVCVRHEGRKST